MLFLEDHFQPLLPALAARRDACDAMVCAMSAGEVTKLTRMGRFDMSAPSSGPMALLKKLRGNKGAAGSAGANQMAILRRIPKLLRFIPGTAQDVRAYFLTLQYWLAGSEENMANMVRYLVNRYADGPRKHLRGSVKAPPPTEYPEVGVYHPRLANRVAETIDALPPTSGAVKATVGLLVMRSYVLAGNAGHYDGVISALEARGLRVIPAFATGLDARPAIEKFFLEDGHPTIDAMVSLMGFSLVGVPPITTPRRRKKSWSNWMCPISQPTPSNFKRWNNGGNRIAGYCLWNRPLWSPFPNSTARRDQLFSAAAQKAVHPAQAANRFACFRKRRALATCILASNARICSPRGSKSSPFCAGPRGLSAR